MTALPQPMHSVASQVYSWWQQRGESEPERQHLGASVIGHECERAIWYGWRWASPRQFDGRLYRLFERGRNEEKTIVQELRGIGCEVSDTRPDGGQWGFKDIGGHFAGSIDFAVLGLPEAPKTWHVGEAKTHSQKSYDELVKKGVAEAKPQHHSQVTIYMGQLGMERALYYAINKNDDSIYTERVHFDPVLYAKLMARAKRIIESTEPPPRISNDASWYQCRLCDHNAICHGVATASAPIVPRVHCRTCAHATPDTSSTDGVWKCEAPDTTIVAPDFATQQNGCYAHRFIPILLERFAEYEGTPDGKNPLYKNKATNARFRNGDEGCEPSIGTIPAYSSAEIRAAQDKAALGDPGVQEFRTTFGARIAA